MVFPTIKTNSLSDIKEKSLREAFQSSTHSNYEGYVNFIDEDGIDLTWHTDLLKFTPEIVDAVVDFLTEGTSENKIGIYDLPEFKQAEQVYMELGLI